MATRKHMKRVYCCVYGCLNSSIVEPTFSFFKLPTDAARRSEWLRLICRDDLLDAPAESHTVCEVHFDAHVILPGLRRKTLKKHSLPTLYLPDLNAIDSQSRPQIWNQDQKLTENANDAPETSSLPIIKSIKTETDTDEYQERMFHELCDKLLTNQLTDLIKAHTYLKAHYTENHQDYHTFCLKLYYASPQAYRFLQSALCLPRPKTLNRHAVPITSEFNDTVMSVLKTKVETMSDKEKNCSVVINTMNLKGNLVYNNKQDHIVGFHEVDGIQTPEPATKALVVMVRGILVNWNQPVGYALLSQCRNYDEISNWIDKLLQKLFEVGLKVRTFVSDVESDFFDAVKIVTFAIPYFFINNNKIYYILDAPHLIKSVFNNLKVYDFHFQGRVAKYGHILQFYNKDKHKVSKLAYKLTYKHFKPTVVEKMEVSHATQVLSNSVAAGLSAYIDFKVINESGRDTVEFIKLMNNLFDSLNSSDRKDDYEYRRAFQGSKLQIKFFQDIMQFFQSLKVINPRNQIDFTSRIKFIRGFQITVRSILQLFHDLKSEGHTCLLTKRLNRDIFEDFFNQIRSTIGVATEPTSRQFLTAFRTLFLSNIVKPPKEINYTDDLGQLLLMTNKLRIGDDTPERIGVSLTPNIGIEEAAINYQITSSEYNKLDLPKNDSIVYICSYLLQKCVDYHNDCEILKSYIVSDQHINEHRYCRYKQYKGDDILRSVLKGSPYQIDDNSRNNSKHISMAPWDHLIEYVERMEDKFRCSFKLRHINNKVVATILNDVSNDITFSPPCPCFPTFYMSNLYIRLRIFFTLKNNNKDLSRHDGKQKRFCLKPL